MSSKSAAMTTEAGTNTTTDADSNAPPLKSLAQMAEQKLLDDLADSLDTTSRSATFACGGSVPIITSAESDKSKKPSANTSQVHSILPVQLRFVESGEGINLTLPGADVSSAAFQALLSACQPASFGRGGEAVFDENYRKAGKLDTSDFLTNFCPYKVGIIDIVTQLLLPQTEQDKHMRSITAELYKLNIYSAPSGKFEPHVDTPRSEFQIGSLVVGLPMKHTGGSLAVRHGGKELLFDWSTPAGSEGTEEQASDMAPAVQWAAFYSDCEHEVNQVISGHRVALTYNLFVSRGQGHLAGSTPVLDATQLPFYGTLRDALATPSFLAGGDIPGIKLAHSYAHTNSTHNFLPASLKGADLSMYECARALNLECMLGSATEGLEYDYEDDTDIPHAFYTPFKDIWEDTRCDTYDIIEEIKDQGTLLSSRKILWLNTVPNQEEAQIAFGGTYGNEPGVKFWYSHAVMFIRVPKFSDRGMSVKPKQSLRKAIASHRKKLDEESCDSGEEASDDGEEEEAPADEEEGEASGGEGEAQDSEEESDEGMANKKQRTK